MRRAISLTVAAVASLIGRAAIAAEQPKDIVSAMYRSVLTDSYSSDITSKARRSTYLVPALVHLYDENDATTDSGGGPCVDINLEINGQDVDKKELRKTLTIEEASNDGTHAVIVSKLKTFGHPGSFRYEFVRGGESWKISDIVLPGGDRLSKFVCGKKQIAPEKEPPNASRVPADTATYRAKAMAFLAPDVADARQAGDSEPKISLNLVDLNGDGVPEAFATVEGGLNCGTRGCTAYILDLSGPTARSIGDFIAWGLKVLPTKTGGWRDVSVTGHKQVFRGGKYTSD